MALTLSIQGTDIKIKNGVSVIYVPASSLKQRAVGTTVELYEDGKLFRSDLESDYTTPSGTAEQICDSIAALSGASAGTVQGLPYLAAVSRGLVAGVSDFSFSSVNDKVKTTETTIWEGLQDQRYVFGTADRTMYINSDSTSDVTQDVLVTGCNTAGALVFTQASLNGRSQIALPANLRDVFSAIIVHATDSPVGNVYITDATGLDGSGVPNATNSTKAQIMIGNNATDNGIRVIPAGKVMEVLAIKFGSGKADDFTFKIRVKPVGNVAFRTIEIKSYEAFILSPIPLWVQLTAGVEIEFSAICATTNKACNIIVDAILRDV
jgi:hypothetical protein